MNLCPLIYVILRGEIKIVVARANKKQLHSLTSAEVSQNCLGCPYSHNNNLIPLTEIKETAHKHIPEAFCG